MSSDLADAPPTTHRRRYVNAPRPSRAKRPPLPVVDHAGLESAARSAAQANITAKRDVAEQGAQADVALLRSVSAEVNEVSDAASRVRTDRNRLIVQLAYHHEIMGLGRVAGIGLAAMNEIKANVLGRPLPKQQDRAAAALAAKIKPARNVDAALRALAKASGALTELEARRDEFSKVRNDLVVLVYRGGVTKSDLAGIMGVIPWRVTQILREKGADMERSAS